KKSSDLVRRRPAVKYAAIANRATSGAFTVAFMCHELGVSRSAYYRWRTAPVSDHDRQDRVLMRLIKTLFHHGRGNPGVRRMQAGLAAAGHRVARKRVWRLMRALGLAGRHPRAWRTTTTHGAAPVAAPALIGQDFTATRADEKWCGDITYI